MFLFRSIKIYFINKLFWTKTADVLTWIVKRAVTDTNKVLHLIFKIQRSLTNYFWILILDKFRVLQLTFKNPIIWIQSIYFVPKLLTKLLQTVLCLPLNYSIDAADNICFSIRFLVLWVQSDAVPIDLIKL